MNLYYSNNITRNSCYTCPYAREERVSDLTVSDFWGIENLNEEFEDKLGVSMVMVNTLKGEKLFSLVSGEKITADLTVAKQPQLKAPAKKPNSRDCFWAEYQNNGVLKVLKKYGSVKEGFKTKIYNLKKKIFK